MIITSNQVGLMAVVIQFKSNEWRYPTQSRMWN